MARSSQELTLGMLSGHTDQWLRAWRVILSGFNMPGGGGNQDSLILSSEAPTGYGSTRHDYASGLRVTFQVNQANSMTPNTAEITIYNLDDKFADNLIKENSYVILQAGYEWGNAGTIFTGTIKAYKKGHESVTDSYLKIYAADGDEATNKVVVNRTLKENTPAKDKLDYLSGKLGEKGVTKGYVDPDAVVLPPNIRPDVLYGLVADQLRDFHHQNGAIGNILDQKYNYARPQDYIPGAVVELTAASGIIGFPEQTQDGINVTCLINSAIRLRQRIRIKNELINQYRLPGNADRTSGDYFSFNYPNYGSMQSYARLSDDGVYCPWQITYEGDSRGGPWYMHMVCMTVDSSKDSGRLGSVLGAFLTPRW